MHTLINILIGLIYNRFTFQPSESQNKQTSVLISIKDINI